MTVKANDSQAFVDLNLIKTGQLRALLDSFVAGIPALLQRMLRIPTWKY
jgi:hypothetical protein